MPVLLAWERANAADQATLKKLVLDWRRGSMKGVADLLAKYETLGASLDLMRQYLDKARQTIRVGALEIRGDGGLTNQAAYCQKGGQCTPWGVVPVSDPLKPGSGLFEVSGVKRCGRGLICAIGAEPGGCPARPRG